MPNEFHFVTPAKRGWNSGYIHVLFGCTLKNIHALWANVYLLLHIYSCLIGTLNSKSGRQFRPRSCNWDNQSWVKSTSSFFQRGCEHLYKLLASLYVVSNCALHSKSLSYPLTSIFFPAWLQAFLCDKWLARLLFWNFIMPHEIQWLFNSFSSAARMDFCNRIYLIIIFIY